jgi:tRNA(Arg) A34 adenosine deaminase TadA
MELAQPWIACLEEAWAAYKAGSLPIGAAYVAPDGAVLLRGRNRMEEPPGGEGLSGSRVAHAEMDVLRQAPTASFAEMKLGALYTSLEPCPMCFGAALMCGVREIRYAARDGWAGSANLVAASPYVTSKRMRVTGPEPMVEAVSLVLLTESSLRRASPRGLEVVQAFAQTDPDAVELGRAWLREDRLQAEARRGTAIQDICRDVWRELGYRD